MAAPSFRARAQRGNLMIGNQSLEDCFAYRDVGEGREQDAEASSPCFSVTAPASPKAPTVGTLPPA